MQMIPGLDRSSSAQAPSTTKSTSSMAEAAEVFDGVQKSYEKLMFEKDYLVDWYERKTNQRVDPGQIVLNVLGPQAYQEYTETLNKIKDISDNLKTMTSPKPT